MQRAVDPPQAWAAILSGEGGAGGSFISAVAVRTPEHTLILRGGAMHLDGRKQTPTGSVVFEEGKGGLPVCKLTHKNGGTAEVYLFGACVTSW